MILQYSVKHKTNLSGLVYRFYLNSSKQVKTMFETKSFCIVVKHILSIENQFLYSSEKIFTSI